jgi:hypothetical protein
VSALRKHLISSADYDDVEPLGVPYLVRNNERERGSMMNRNSGQTLCKFDERTSKDSVDLRKFNSRIGNLVLNVRSPLKEARILNIVRGRPDFMQGRLSGFRGKPLRIMDFIRGKQWRKIP